MARLKSLHLLLSFATLGTTLSATGALAQTGSVSSDSTLPTPNYTQSTPAPIERATPAPDTTQVPQQEPLNGNPQYPGPPSHMRRAAPQPTTVTSQPAPGVFLRAEHTATVETVSTSKDTVELRLTHGKANVTVHQPAENTAILVDLPGGQVSLLKDGLYTFNAEANRVSVLVGEARAYPAADKDDKGIKVKEDHQLVLADNDPRSVDVGPYEARADLLPSGNHGEPYRPGYPGASAFYGEPYAYGYPYSAWDYGYPYYGWGVPIGIGVGFGYFGGWGGGWGYRGWR
jgi:hypothetical protein